MATEEKNAATLRPLQDRVLLRRLEAEETLKGGIILPDTAKKQKEQAEVIAVGPGKKNKEGILSDMPVAKGDVVLIDKYSGQEVEVDNIEYVIVRADDIIAKIEQ